jgi:hypothetical protein
VPQLPHLPANVVRFHWEEVGHLDGTRRVPVVDVQVQTDDGAWTVGLEVLPGIFCAHGADGECEIDGGHGFVDGAIGRCEIAPPEAGLIVGEAFRGVEKGALRGACGLIPELGVLELGFVNAASEL